MNNTRDVKIKRKSSVFSRKMISDSTVANIVFTTIFKLTFRISIRMDFCFLPKIQKLRG